MNNAFDSTTILAAGDSITVHEQFLGYNSGVASVELSNDGGTNPLTAFKVQGQDHPNGEFYDLDYSGSSTISGAPASLAHGAKAHLRLTVTGIYAIRFVASSTLGTTVSVRGGASNSQNH